MAINPDKCIKVTGRFHSTQGTVGDPALTNIVSGADEVYDDVAPYRANGHIDCTAVTPVGTENPVELRWYEKVNYGTEQEPLYDWIRSQDTTVDNQKTYGIPNGAKQSDVNDQLYTMVGDITAVTITPSGEVVSSDANKIINQQDGYIPTAGAVGRALGANFEDNLQSTSTVKGLTANQGRVLNEKKADKNGWYEQLVAGASLSVIGDDVDNKAKLFYRETGDSEDTGGTKHTIEKGTATVNKIGGHTVKFNQLVQNGNFIDGTTGWVALNSTITAANNVCTLTTATRYGGVYREVPNLIEGHKLFICIDITSITSGATFAFALMNSVSQWVGNLRTITATGRNKHIESCPANATRISMGNNMVSGTSYDVSFTNVQIHDLTAIFGTDAEIAAALGIAVSNITTATGVAAFEAWLALNPGYQDYYPYNTGSLISLKPKKLISKCEFNKWDEQWTNGYYLNGVYQDGVTNVCSVNPIRISPDATYYFRQNSATANGIIFYDAQMNYISTASKTGNQIVPPPANAYYMHFYLSTSYGNRYNGDICINVSDNNRNGTYLPYWDSEVDLSWIMDIPDPNDSSKKLFPYGLLSAGSVKDEVYSDRVVKRVGVLNMGDYTYYFNPQFTWFYYGPISFIKRPTTASNYPNLLCTQYNILTSAAMTYGDTKNGVSFSTDGYLLVKNENYTTASQTANLKQALSNVMLYYELATPITVYFAEPDTHPMNYEVEPGGTEEFVKADAAVGENEPTSTSLTATITYPMDTLQTIRNIENNYMSKAAYISSSNSLVSAINAMNLGYTLAFNETTLAFSSSETVTTQSVENNETI